MTEHKDAYTWQKFVAVAPLVAIIAASLIWSGYATYHHALSPTVPGGIAWALVAALDGTVVVTTPIWLSTVLSRAVRNYAAFFCVLALGGSMLINYRETGLNGVFPPLIAGGLIHLVGLVLREFARLEKAAESARLVESSVRDEESASVPAAGSVEPDDALETPAEPREAPRLLAPPVLPARVQVELEREAAAPTEAPFPLERPAASAMDVVRRILDAAYARGETLPGGAELTAACRAAGFEVNDNYGRSALGRWREKHPMAREDVTV